MAKLLVNRRFLTFLSIAVALLVVTMFGEEVYHLLKAEPSLRPTLIVDHQETIAIILIGLGLVLEGRAEMTAWLLRKGQIAEDPDEDINEACEYHGLIITAVGLFIEIVDQVLSFFEASHTLVMGIQFAVNYPLTLYGIWILCGLCLALIKRDDAAPQAAA